MTFAANNDPDGGDLLIDRLVEGELDDAERRSLLQRLDATPDGWKRCARAFLEAQAWRQSFADAAVQETAAPAPPTPRKSKASVAFAVAAALLLTFGCGLLAGTRFAGSESAATSKPTTEVVSTDPVDEPTRALGQFTWPATLVQGIPSMQITVFEGKGFDEEWIRSQPPAVPELIAKQVERRGCRVHQEREVLPLKLADGRSVAVLVDRNAVQIVGRPVL